MYKHKDFGYCHLCGDIFTHSVGFTRTPPPFILSFLLNIHEMVSSFIFSNSGKVVTMFNNNNNTCMRVHACIAFFFQVTSKYDENINRCIWQMQRPPYVLTFLFCVHQRRSLALNLSVLSKNVFLLIRQKICRNCINYIGRIVVWCWLQSIKRKFLIIV